MSRRVLRPLLCLAVGLLAVAGPAIAAGPAGAADATPAARLVLSSVSPDLVVQDSTVRITGTVTNTGPATLREVSVRLRVVGGRLGSRLDVASWLDGQDAREGVPVAPSADLTAPIEPGKRARFELAVPSSVLGLSGSEFGAYPVAVDARATPDGGVRDQVALIRSTLQWQPAKKQYAAQRITWVVPFTGLPGPTADPRLTVAEVAAALAPGQRLRRLLDGASAPGVVWAVDPELLQVLQEAAAGRTSGGPTDPAATATTTPAAGPTSGDATSPPASPTPGGTPTASPTASADETARAVVRDYLQAMRAAAVGREVIELPYADPDLQALSDANAMPLVPAARAAGAGTVTEVLGVTPRTDIAWPADGYANDDLVRALADQGIGALVLDGRTRPLTEALSYTPDARTTALPGDTTAVLSDTTLSQLARSLRRTDSSARTRFLAETAAATTERPGLTRRLLVTLPRTANPDPVAFRSTVQATASVPWLLPTSLDELLAPVGDRGDSSGSPGGSPARRPGPGPAACARRTSTSRWGCAPGCRRSVRSPRTPSRRRPGCSARRSTWSRRPGAVSVPG